MPTRCSTSSHWDAGWLRDVRMSLVSSSTSLSSTSQSPVVSASSSAKLAAPLRNTVFKAIAQAARGLELWLQHHKYCL